MHEADDICCSVFRLFDTPILQCLVLLGTRCLSGMSQGTLCCSACLRSMVHLPFTATFRFKLAGAAGFGSERKLGFGFWWFHFYVLVASPALCDSPATSFSVSPAAPVAGRLPAAADAAVFNSRSGLPMPSWCTPTVCMEHRTPHIYWCAAGVRLVC